MKTPSNNILCLTLGILLCYLSFDFFTDAKKDFFVLNYNWEQANPVPICDVSVLDYQVNILTIANGTSCQFDNQKTYVVNGKHYFRAERIERTNNTFNFIGIHWINEYPRHLEDVISLGESHLNLVQQSGTKIAMIGDSQMGWREGKYTRKWIAEKLKVHFIGDRHDVFGYPYFFDTSYKSKQIPEEDLKIDSAEVIIMYLGLREDIETYTQNMRNFITRNRGKDIIIIDNALNAKAQKLIINNNSSKENVHFINTSKYSKGKYFWSDKKHLNYEGHKKLAKELIYKLESIGISKN